MELGEIETVLRQHPAVKDATVACVEKGPSDVRPGGIHTSRREPAASSELRGFLSARLQAYMVPNSYTFLQSFPRTPRQAGPGFLPPPELQTGEVTGDCLGPRNEPERRLAKIWEEVLAVEQVGIRDNFFELGGHSLLAVRLSHRIEQEFGRRLPLAMLFEKQTVESLAAALGKLEKPENWSPLVTLRPDGDRPPLVLLHGHGGNLLFYRELVKALGPDQPVYGFQSPGLGRRPSCTRHNRGVGRSLYPGTPERGPPRALLRSRLLRGSVYSRRRWRAACNSKTRAVAFVGSINTDGEWHIVETLTGSIRYHVRNLLGESWRNRLVYIRERLAYRYRLLRRPFAEAHGKRRLVKGRKIAADQVPRYVDAALMGANRRYMAKPFAGKLHLFQGDGDSYRDGESFWEAVASDGVELYRTPGPGN